MTRAERHAANVENRLADVHGHYICCIDFVIIGISSIFRRADIALTERRFMSGKINITSDRLGRIVEDSASEIYVFSAENYKFSLVNRGARENLGYSIDELRSRTPWDIKPEIDREQFLALVEPLKCGEKDRLDFDTLHERKDGSTYNVVVRLQLIKSGDNEIFYAAIEDSTERKQMEAALRVASERLNAILSNTTMAVLMMDERQHCVFANKAAEDLTGYTLEEMQGRTLHDVVHHKYPDGRAFPIEECPIDRAFPENSQTQGEEVFVHKDGTFYPVGFTASPMKDENDRTVGTVIEVKNIAQELEARAALEAFNDTLKSRVNKVLADRKKLETQLFQAQKMEAVGQLTGGVAHDFNNLLQVIGGNLQLLQRELPAADQVQTRVQNALSGVARGGKLAAQLLAFGRQQALEPKPTNISRLVRGMDDMLRRVLGEAVEIETVISGGLWNCLADPAQVENVILNLAINARDAMKSKGKLTIEAGNASLDDSYVRENSEVSAGQYVMLAVTDTGQGIAQELIDKIFEPFFTTKAPGEGTGLGLSMVYGFVKQSGGHIKCYSEVGHGTTIRIYLPRTREEEAIQVSEATAVEEGGNEVILVVEDDEAVRITTTALLRELGYSVLEAENADNGMAIVNSGLKIDLLFTDVVMPGTLRSPDLARRAKEKLPNLGVLFTSGYTQNSIVHAGRLDEGVELIGKPYTLDQLSRKVRQVLDAREVSAAPAEAEPNIIVTDPRTDGPREITSSLNILLVEDEAMIRMMAAEMLVNMGHQVFDVGTIAEARGKLAEEHFDIMLSDIGLPDGSGVDLIRETLETHPNLSIIVASGRALQDEFQDLTPSQRPSLLMKPFDEKALLAALANCSVS